MFYVSSLISGFNIYREIGELESTFLLIIAGTIVFFISPLWFFLLLPSAEYVTNLIQILSFKYFILFVGRAFSFGLVFGYLIILKPRENILCWFRDASGLTFWINSYSLLWDDFFDSIKKGGEIYVETKSDSKPIKCFLSACSIRKESRCQRRDKTVQL